jgi:hypothetical protein
MRPFNNLQKIALSLIVLSTVLLILNLSFNLDYSDMDMNNLALPLSNVLIIISMMLLLFTQKSKK